MAKVKQSRCGRTSTGEASGSDRTIWRDSHGQDIGMHFRCSVRGVKKRLAKAIDGTGSSESLVKKHGAVGHRVIEFLQCGMAVFGPLIGMPSTHRGNPLPFRHGAP